MTPPELFEKASGGNKEASNFLCVAYRHFWQVRQFITDGKKDPHEFIALMAKTNQCFSMPFYVRYADALQISVLRVVQGLSEEVSYSLVADVAFITLGFEGARKLLDELKKKE